MILFLFRTLGFLFLSAAFVFVVYDGTRSIADDAFLCTKVTEFWTSLHAASLQRLQLLFQGNATRWLWEPVAVTVLNAPTFVAFGVAGAIFVLLGARNSGSTVIHSSKVGSSIDKVTQFEGYRVAPERYRSCG